MSANIMWKPVGGGRDLDIAAPSSFIDALTKVFGRMPVILEEAQLPEVRAMAALNPDFAKLADVLENNREGIELWPEY